MKVFKFGGASVKNADGFRNVSAIVSKYGKSEPLVVVVSATGKTTNQLEELIAKKFTAPAESMQLLQLVKEKHLQIAKELFGEIPAELAQQIHEHCVEAEWVIEEEREMAYDYVYDQIICIGELISSRILSAWLQLNENAIEWIDARSIIQTDDTYRDARVQWEVTNDRIKHTLGPLLELQKVIVTQGFIASSTENNSTSLGREGSDYTAAILSSGLGADGMYIWKDVPGVLTADPDLFDHVTKLDRLSYTEAIEMTYYGCKVIHPKTIQPLKSKGIPLFVKSFLDPASEGTLISDDLDLEYPPIVVLEDDQSLIHFSSKDLSFIAEHHLAHLFELFKKHRVKVNMMRNTAISFSVCVRNDPQRIKALIKEVENEYKVLVDQDLELLTIRHYQDAMIPKLLEEKIVILEERIRKTLQMVVKNAPAIVPKKSTT
ncbi:MAG: aspartate kinase [Saprospiraceae bacterium]|nr:aspartate kinase [Saprospiraceae bacterium]